MVIQSKVIKVINAGSEANVRLDQMKVIKVMAAESNARAKMLREYGGT